MAATLDSIHQSFGEWRRMHRLGPYPRRLRDEALAVLTEGELAKLCRRLGLAAGHYQRWRKDEAKQRTAMVAKPSPAVASAREAFFELAPAMPALVSKADMELRFASGVTMHLRGGIEPHLVVGLVKLLRDGGNP